MFSNSHLTDEERRQRQALEEHQASVREHRSARARVQHHANALEAAEQDAVTAETVRRSAKSALLSELATV